MKVHKREEPVISRNHTIWFEPDEGEDWGEIRSDTPRPGRPLKPNRLCVIVGESGGQVHAHWSQAREVRVISPGTEQEWEDCVGTASPESRQDIADNCSWWWDALFEAEKIVREELKK